MCPALGMRLADPMWTIIIRILHFVTKGTITILINGSKPNDVERHWNYVQFKLLIIVSKMHSNEVILFFL